MKSHFNAGCCGGFPEDIPHQIVALQHFVDEKDQQDPKDRFT